MKYYCINSCKSRSNKAVTLARYCVGQIEECRIEYAFVPIEEYQMIGRQLLGVYIQQNKHFRKYFVKHVLFLSWGNKANAMPRKNDCIKRRWSLNFQAQNNNWKNKTKKKRMGGYIKHERTKKKKETQFI